MAGVHWLGALQKPAMDRLKWDEQANRAASRQNQSISRPFHPILLETRLTVF
jgi:hypothetical protein